MVRLLTYALLIKYGFKVLAGGRLLNPAAVFCTDRELYYAKLAQADSGSDAALEDWCVYVLGGVLEELRKVDSLTDYAQLCSRILLLALAYAKERQLVTPYENAILTTAVKAGVVKAGDLAAIVPDFSPTQRTYQIKKLVERGLLQPVESGARQYVIGFANSYLLRGVIRALTDAGFIPASVSAPPTAQMESPAPAGTA